MNTLLLAKHSHINPKDVEAKLVQLSGINSIHNLQHLDLGWHLNILPQHAVNAPDMQSQ